MPRSRYSLQRSRVVAGPRAPAPRSAVLHPRQCAHPGRLLPRPLGATHRGVQTSKRNARAVVRLVSLWLLPGRRHRYDTPDHNRPTTHPIITTLPCPITITTAVRTSLVYCVATMSCLAVLHGRAACWQPPQPTQPLLLRDSYSHAVSAATTSHGRRYEDDDDDASSKSMLPPLLLAYYNGFSLDHSATVDHSIHIYDASSRCTVASLRGHSHEVEWLAWSPCGTRLLSGTAEHAVLLWHVERQCAEYLLRGRRLFALMSHIYQCILSTNVITNFLPTTTLNTLSTLNPLLGHVVAWCGNSRLIAVGCEETISGVGVGSAGLGRRVTSSSLTAEGGHTVHSVTVFDVMTLTTIAVLGGFERR